MNPEGKQKFFALLVALSLIQISCRSKPAPNSAQHGNSSVIGLPPDSSPTDLLSTSTDRTVIVVYQPREDRSAYLYNPSTRTLEKLITAKMVSVFRQAGGDTFVVAWSAPDGPKYALLDAQGQMSAAKEFRISPESWPSCGASRRYLVCATDRPGLTEADADFNPLGYTAFLVLELATNSSRVYRVPSPTSYITFSSNDDLVYTSSELSENARANVVTAFDLNGRKRAVHKDWKGTNFSVRNRFAIPFLHEGGLDWEVYETRSWRPVLSIKSSEFEGEINWGEWNPVQENLLSVWRRQMSDNKFEVDFLEVYNVETGKKVYSIKIDSNNADSKAVHAWSRDGHRLMVLDRGALKCFSVQW